MVQEVKDLSLSTAVAAVARVQFLAWELPHAMGMAKKRKEKKRREEKRERERGRERERKEGRKEGRKER